MTGVETEVPIPNSTLNRIEMLSHFDPQESKRQMESILEQKERMEIANSKDAYLFPAQAARFEKVLTALIERDIKNRKCAYLVVDEDGPGGILAVALAEAEIDSDTYKVLPECDMFVEENEVSMRFWGEEPLHVLAQTNHVEQVAKSK